MGYVSSDVADPDPVTPNVLLMGRRDASLPQAIYAPDPLSKRRWRHSQIMADQFWSHFLRQYLPQLQSRQRWQRPNDDLTLGAVVMIVDPQLPRAHWPVGRVEKLIPSKDGCIRSAEVKVNDRTYWRPMSRLIKLPAIPEEDEVR